MLRLIRVAAFLMAGVLASPSAIAQSSIVALHQKVEKLYQQGKYAEAIPHAERLVSMVEKAVGRNHPDLATVMTNLAALYRAQGMHAKAEPLLERSLTIRTKTLGAAHPEVANTLINQGAVFIDLGRNGEAAEAFERSVKILAKSKGPKRADYASALIALGTVYSRLDRHAEAEELYKKGLSTRQEVLGRIHADVGNALVNLAMHYHSQARYEEAEPLYKSALATYEEAVGTKHPDYATTLDAVASFYQQTSRFDEAEQYYAKALSIREQVLGTEHGDVASSLNSLAVLFYHQGRYGQAEQLYKKSLAIREKAFGPTHASVGQSLNNLATLYLQTGKYDAAETAYKRSLAILEKALGPEHTEVANTLSNLGTLYSDALGRISDAEPLFKRTLAINEKTFGREHPSVASQLQTLGLLYQQQERYSEAEQLLLRSLAIFERHPGTHARDVASVLNSLATVYTAQGRDAEAEPLFAKSLSVYEAKGWTDQYSAADTVNNLGLLYQSQKRYDRAEHLLKRALVIRANALGADHLYVSNSFNNLAAIYFQQRDWKRAADHWRESTHILIRNAKRSNESLGQPLKGEGRTSAAQSAYQFVSLVKAAYQLDGTEDRPSSTLAAELFETAQWAHTSQAAQSLAQLAARNIDGNDGAAQLMRERQDLVTEWQSKEKMLIAAKGAEPDARNAEQEAKAEQRLAAIDLRIAEIDSEVGALTNTAALSNGAPLSVAEAQADLRDDEALVLFLDTPSAVHLPEETFVWVVTKTEVRLARSELGSDRLTQEVAALRCGLDYDGTWATARARCSELLKVDYSQDDLEAYKPLPFDVNRAYELYASLFSQVQELIQGRKLLVVPSGALTQLPFQVLVTQPAADRAAAGDALKDVAWLIKSNAVSVLPSVSSLKALRRFAKSSSASKALAGFGNPLLDGQDPDDATWAKAARQRETCAGATEQVTASLGTGRAGVRPLEMRGGLANITDIRRQAPLPETADELCTVARDLGADSRDIRLGSRTTETEIKRMSASGELAQYKVLHFATHGTLAGQIGGSTEPGLLLTPPASASVEDDGYLSSTDIARLKIDADWVILSACNTAAGGADGAEALSGLARSFFYAGARALLVSHWSVYSDAAVNLITGSISRLAANPTIGRAEALRGSMLKLIDGGGATAHPAYWAPFEIVGEGA